MIFNLPDGKEKDVEVPQVMFPDVDNTHIAKLNGYGRTLVRIDMDACRSAGINENVFVRIMAVAPQIAVYMDGLFDMCVELGFEGIPHFEDIRALLHYIESAVQIAPSKSPTSPAGEEVPS